MFEREDELVDRVVRELRRPVQINPGLDARVMHEIALDAAPPPAVLPRRRRIARWPWGGLAAAAILAAALIARPWSQGPGENPFQFVLVAPQASSVALVGDFNDWDPARSPMQAHSGAGVWATVVRLSPGRYRYAFLVNGVEWRADPAAPKSIDDEFGPPSSVVTVGGKRS